VCVKDAQANCCARDNLCAGCRGLGRSISDAFAPSIPRLSLETLADSRVRRSTQVQLGSVGQGAKSRPAMLAGTRHSPESREATSAPCQPETVQPQSLALRTETPSRPQESLSGLIERVTFFSEENGWAVLKVKANGHRDLATVVGSLQSVSAGEWVTEPGQFESALRGEVRVFDKLRSFGATK
jgi:hypothetical protein